jgi:hypothetical protein
MLAATSPGTAAVAAGSPALASEVSVLTRSGPPALGRAGSGNPASDAGAAVDISRTAAGARIARAAQQRFEADGFRVPTSELGVWDDAAGTLVALRGGRFVALERGLATDRHRVELLPIAAPPSRASLAHVNAAVDDQPTSWSLVFSQCYERISDTWAWLDHCARIYRLIGDADTAHDYYGLQRVATAGSNAPWVLKSASIKAMPVDANLMSWVDWSPRGDRSGACQSFVVWVSAPLAGMMVPVDRCETWDITKGVHGGDFRLDWYGCACTHERALVFDVAVSVPQGRAPAWYVPAEVHGFPF